MTDDELRQLDRELTGLMGYSVVRGAGRSYYLCHGDKPVSRRARGNGETEEDVIAALTPRFSRTWEGFGLLVEECKRRGWAQEIYSHTTGWLVTLCDDCANPASADTLPHAFALAMRDPLKAAKEREG